MARKQRDLMVRRGRVRARQHQGEEDFVMAAASSRAMVAVSLRAMVAVSLGAMVAGSLRAMVAVSKERLHRAMAQTELELRLGSPVEAKLDKLCPF